MHDRRVFASFAILASLVLHGLLVWFVLQQAIEAAHTTRSISVMLIRQPPPKQPLPAKPVQAIRHVATTPPPMAKPIHHAPPRLMLHAKPKIHALQHRSAKRAIAHLTKPEPPIMHFGAASAQADLGMDLGAPSGGSANGHGSISGFDDTVKQRIQAAKTYPPGIPHMWNECIVEYRVTIDRNGQLLDYKLYGCGDPFLDSAARAAILMAAPFPLPPDFGGNQYTVYGSLVFRHR